MPGTFFKSAIDLKHPPEILGKTPGMLDHVLAELSARGVECRARVELE